ncbi:DUF4179 domain-containing protein [Macrococcus sp. DPC7161]|uniref:DUF4179 domain-containing protein n=1 Tax=Macrococcus sp. DPC7161 TaxID=2507060 RepID=UPI00100A6F49|nr:DUF4179 domain-containing protein [Macrococcus sp. DPC7161]RXK17444.1 DUF4179 domain-containing protein [Macrococcus sp. DPC7161]
MNSFLYEKFNEIETDTLEEVEMSAEEQNQYLNQFKKSVHQKQANIQQPSKLRKYMLSSVAAASLLIATPFIALNESVQASATKWIEDIQYSFKDILTPKAEKYATHVNETITLKNKNVRLVDVFAEGKFFTYNELIDNKSKKAENTTSSSIISLKINGKEMFEGYSGSSEDLKSNITSNIGIVHLRDEVPKSTYHVEMKLGPLSGEGEVYAYQFDVDPTTFNKKVKTMRIDKRVKLNNRNNVKIETLTLNPLSAMIEHVSSSNHHFDMMIYDEKGKKYYFNAIKTDEDKNKSKSTEVFNPDIHSTGTIDDLNKAKSLYAEVIDYGVEHNGEMKIEKKSKRIKIK